MMVGIVGTYLKGFAPCRRPPRLTDTQDKCEVLRAPLGFFGCFVGVPWKLLWVAFRPSWAVLGPLWGALGSSWGALGPSGGLLGAVIGRLGVILEPCRAVLGRLEAVWDPQAAQEAPEVTIHRPCQRSRASMCSEFEFWRAGGRNP